MTPFIQHAVVGLIVAGAFAFVAWQALRGFWGKSSRIGSCCTRGCDAMKPHEQTQPPAARTERVVFLPLESLSRRR